MDMKNIEIEIREDGSAIAVWDDSCILHVISDHIEVTRLSDVEFDNEAQGWRVTFKNGITLPSIYKRRIEALNAEINYVEDHLSEFGDWVKSNYPRRVIGASFDDCSDIE